MHLPAGVAPSGLRVAVSFQDQSHLPLKQSRSPFQWSQLPRQSRSIKNETSVVKEVEQRDVVFTSCNGAFRIAAVVPMVKFKGWA